MKLEPLRTPRLTLTPLTADLASRLLAGDLTGVPASTGWPHEDTLDGLRMATKHGHPPGWLVVHRGLVVGDCGLHGLPDDQGRVESGYGLAPEARGQGLGTELVHALSAWLLTQPGVQAVQAHVNPNNTASRRVLEKAGFHHQAQEEDDLLYELE